MRARIVSLFQCFYFGHLIVSTLEFFAFLMFVLFCFIVLFNFCNGFVIYFF
jgi:hypothetical protein